MKHSTVRHRLGAVAIAALLSACATQPGQEADQGMQQQIATAERAGNLEALFEKLATEAGKKGLFGADKEAQAAMREAGRRLAAVKQEEGRAMLKQGRLPGGQAPLALLSQAESLAGRMQRWDTERQTEFVSELASERARTQSALDQTASAYRSLDESALPARFRLLGETAALTGGNSPEGQAILRGRERLVREVFEAAVRDLEALRLDEAEARFSGVAEVAPDYPDVERQIAHTRTRQFEFLANNRRDEAGADQALALYSALRRRADFADLKPLLSPAAVGLSRFMAAKGGTAAAEDKLPEAYAWLSRVRALRELQDGRQGLSQEEKRFAEQAFVLAETAGKRNQPGLALGYLFVLQTVYPDFPGLKRGLRDMQDRSLDRATKKITAANFSGSNESARVAGSVASKLTQMLFRALPDDIRIVERDQIQAVMREQEIVALQGTGGVDLSAADYLVQGAILEATVENSEKKGRKTVRVVTRKGHRANPGYAEWAKGPRNTPPPTEFIEEPVYEDIPLNLTLHRKVGVLGVSYRIVDASNARMLFTETLTRKRVESGESSEGMQLGEFNAPMKIAELPSDSEILESLADEVVGHIGRQMIEFLRDPEAKYEAAAARHKSEDNPAAAAEMLANAWSLAQKKGKPQESLGEQLREMALRARPAS
ncbi:MAG: CsgG/HfaB family protein [Pseudomonadota bacterium]|nr:CsgG/HfaB family protein [Pseudomonadota bacterium]